MKQSEADAMAKAIRNRVKIPIGYKQEFVHHICAVLLEENQFFNATRFKDISLQEFPEGWPNRMDRL